MGAASPALFQEADAAYRIGVLVGQITALLMLLVGSLKCLSMLRRPTVNRKCLLALGVVLEGTAWQLILWGARKDRAAVKSDALTLFPNFSVTAP
jgi:hypothetical protein